MQEKNKRKRRFKGVIFDMDGCLIDSERLYAQCWKMAFHKMGIPISDETLDSWNGIGGKDLDRAIESVTGEARLIPELRAIRDGYLAGALEDGRIPDALRKGNRDPGKRKKHDRRCGQRYHSGTGGENAAFSRNL